MLKNSIIYVLTFITLFLLGYNVHTIYLVENQIDLVFSLQGVYIFHALFSLVICIVFSIISLKQKILEQLGFIYLGTLILKITVFVLVFYNPLFSRENLSKTDSLSLLIPIAVFLIAEVYFIAKILNRK